MVVRLGVMVDAVATTMQEVGFTDLLLFQIGAFRPWPSTSIGTGGSKPQASCSRWRDRGRTATDVAPRAAGRAMRDDRTGDTQHAWHRESTPGKPDRGAGGSRCSWSPAPGRPLWP